MKSLESRFHAVAQTFHRIYKLSFTTIHIKIGSHLTLKYKQTGSVHNYVANSLEVWIKVRMHRSNFSILIKILKCQLSAFATNSFSAPETCIMKQDFILAR